ncbi:MULTISPECIES: hypothetical protein [Klebsiella pneumoniae complex]|nr:hypothetical protein [Klebsiella pneumoniae]MDF1983143.1 hypothetical protein [Klebsiella pneumoniae]HCD5479164.1 hypothetical protein [Klebsiella pneumoniae]HCM5778875.1 hypothetical protein [Klebsiella variicola subsp. variicola]HCM6632393.1 hypothetical protein [Klebsiella variicola subsp. variicola]
MTIDVNILSISIICVVIRFVYVASFRVTRHQYVTGKNATAKSIKKLRELSALHHVIKRLFPKVDTHKGLLRIIVRNSAHSLQEMERAALMLNDDVDGGSEQHKDIFESASLAYCNSFQVISMISQIIVELEPLHKNGVFIEEMYSYLTENGVFDHANMLKAAERYGSETAVMALTAFLSRSGEGLTLLQKRVEAKSFGQLVGGSLPP